MEKWHGVQHEDDENYPYRSQKASGGGRKGRSHFNPGGVLDQASMGRFDIELNPKKRKDNNLDFLADEG